MLKVEIHRRCTPVSLRNNPECCPDVTAARQRVPSCKEATTEQGGGCSAFRRPSVWFVCTTFIQQRILTGCSWQMLQSVHYPKRMKNCFCAREGSHSKHVIDFLQFQIVIRLKAQQQKHMLAVLSVSLDESTIKSTPITRRWLTCFEHLSRY